MGPAMRIEVLPLEKARLEDYLHFFDRVAFTDNPDWAGCYCLFYHIPEGEWEKRSGAQNREGAAGLIRDGGLSGFLAYEGGKPVGWCNANRKERYALLAGSRELWDPQEDGSRTLSVVCFVIAPEHRRRGIARSLLSAACAAAQVQGLVQVEAYPRKQARTAAQHCHGPLELYLGQGFTVHRELPDYWIVRRSLHPGRAAK
jgi:ribosomal protein S18 acetylase RimI-like enzyme